jgi:gluconate 2-dehydrogenase gamma chain
VEGPVSRRTFVTTLAGTVGGVWLTAHGRELLAAADHVAKASRESLQTFQALSVADAREIEAAAAQIIPSDGTPGARDARVINFIDRSLVTFAKDRKKGFEDLAADLRKRASRQGAQSFASLTDAQQIKVLEAMERDSKEAFELLRSTTIVGMLANPSYGGNVDKAGWKWIGFNDQFSWVAPFGWYDRNER